MKDATLLFYTNSLKVDMLKTICTALKHELVSSKPVKKKKRFYIFFTRKNSSWMKLQIRVEYI